MANEGLTLVRDRWYTALTADVSAGVTTLPVVTNTVNGNVLPTPCIIMCGFEQMYATGSTATTITVTRGFNSTAAAHAKGATVGIARVAAHHNDMVTGLLSVGAGGTIPRRNRLINGSMRVSQRLAVTATATATDNTYQSVDRWRSIVNTTAGSSPLISQQANNTGLGQTRNYVNLQSQGGTGKFGIFQVLETADVSDLRGQTVSLRWTMAAGASITDVKAVVLQWTGTADAVSADPVTTWAASGSGVTTYSGSWAQANTPAAIVPTSTALTYKIEGITITSSSSLTNLAVMIWCDNTTTTSGQALSILDAQIEKGSACTDFEQIPYAQDLWNCLYYCYAPANEFVGRATTVQYLESGAYYYPRPMRVAPTITNGSFSVNAGNAGTFRAQSSGLRSCFLDNSAANWTASALVVVSATFSAEL